MKLGKAKNFFSGIASEIISGSAPYHFLDFASKFEWDPNTFIT